MKGGLPAITVTGKLTLSSRADQRAEARAGRTCPVCGEPVAAQRSTRRFCSTPCRVKAHQASVSRRPKEGLRPAQVRILALLAKAIAPVERRWIAKGTGVRGWLSDYLGQIDPWKRAAREAKTGILSLVTLGLVLPMALFWNYDDPSSRKMHCCEITATGREALAAAGPA